MSSFRKILTRAAAAAFLISAPALAHESWIAKGGYRSPATGEWCCGQFDCVAVPQSEVKITPIGYELPTGEVVPHKETLISEDGKYWRCHRPTGGRRCFFAPGHGS